MNSPKKEKKKKEKQDEYFRLSLLTQEQWKTET